MKKKARKLRLQRETVWSLGQDELSQVVGRGDLLDPGNDKAEDPQPLSSGPSWCGC